MGLDWVLRNRLTKKADPCRTLVPPFVLRGSLVTLLIPGTAILLGHFVLREPFAAREVVGALVVACALLIVDGRAQRLFRRA